MVAVAVDDLLVESKGCAAFTIVLVVEGDADVVALGDAFVFSTGLVVVLGGQQSSFWFLLLDCHAVPAGFDCGGAVAVVGAEEATSSARVRYWFRGEDEDKDDLL